MTEPRRLLDDAATSELQRSLLGSLAGESPRREARERTLAALGLPAAVGGAAAPATASKAAGVTSGAGAGSSAATAVGTLGWIKWGGILMALSMIGGSAYVVATHGTPEPRASAPAIQKVQTAPIAETVQTPPPDTSAVTLPTLPTLSPESLPPAKETQPKAAPVTRSAPASSGTLMEELSLMDRARQSFAQGSYGDATRAVSTYETRYPHGSFAQEADFIRVRALYAQNSDEAPAAARAFLTRYPSSPYAPRVRTLVGGGP